MTELAITSGSTVTDVAPGDVLVVRSKDWWSKLIRLGAALRDEPNMQNHVAVASHRDAAGVLWGVEARAGGVGWVDLSVYTASRWTVTNAQQPKDDLQRARIVDAATAMLGTSYDWEAIGVDGLQALHLSKLWHCLQWDGAGKPPAHVVCSSLADYIYGKCGLKSPGNGRWTTPADWAEFIQLQEWED